MYLIRFDAAENTPSMLQLARRCKIAIDLGYQADLKAVFVGLNHTTFVHLLAWQEQTRLFSINDWANALNTIFALVSDHCPNCGLTTFADSDIVAIYCSVCGANPGTIFEEAGGPFFP